ncbi:MAG: ASCH domain-containing protein [Nitrososphaerota archaeon]|nr:ASCH domain-containing protein [Nitrososphaerota archaeon]
MNDAVLSFSVRVLGTTASQALRDGKVLQSIRSRHSAAPFLRRRGQVVAVYLDGKFLYHVRITEIKQKPLRDLTQFDAELGGFLTLKELQGAVKRAGFRFKPLHEYTGTFAIQFQQRPAPV